jgi:curved DNA-binding protein
VELSDVFHGATKKITFQTYEAHPDGQLREKAKTLQVKIPKGVVDGSVIRLTGQGEKGIGQGPDGDLFLKISLNPHPQFHVKGHDLHTSVAISPWEAALGAKIPVKTVEKSVTLTIPPGTQSGKLLRLKGKGIPKTTKGAGDIIIEIEIRVPAHLSEKEKELFLKLAQSSSFNPREERRQRAKEHDKV